MKKRGRGACRRHRRPTCDVAAKLSGDILPIHPQTKWAQHLCRSSANWEHHRAIASDQLVPGEEIADLKGRGLGRVGAMRDVVADAGAEVVSNSAGCGLLWISGTHGVAPFCDGA